MVLAPPTPTLGNEPAMEIMWQFLLSIFCRAVCKCVSAIRKMGGMVRSHIGLGLRKVLKKVLKKALKKILLTQKRTQKSKCTFLSTQKSTQ